MTPEKYQELKNEIINQAHYQDLKKYIAHGHTSCFEHSIRVADRCFKFINRYQVKCNHEALINGALLHDYYLYDWHDNNGFRFHGLKHHNFAVKNALADYQVDPKVAHIIKAHMFPLTFWLIPKSKEAFIVSYCDKMASIKEILKIKN